MNDENELLAELSNYDDSIHDQLVDDKGFTNMAEEPNPQQQNPPLPQLDAQGLAELQGNAAKAQGFLPDNPLQLLSEAGTALVGGTADAIDSVGSFGDLVGDTLKTGVNKIFGKSDDTQNPFSKDYQKGAWWDIPDDIVPENQSGLGQLTRGLVEFGLLSVATGKAGAALKLGSAAGKISTSQKLYNKARLAGFGTKGSKFISFIPKGAKIASDGAIADLISNSSEMGNIANLVNEYAPFIPFSEALAVDPDKDTAWIARIKSMTAGSTMNLTGHFLAAVIKHGFRAGKNVKNGMSVEEANFKANEDIAKEMEAEFELDDKNFSNVEAYNRSRGLGIANRDKRFEYNAEHLDMWDIDEFQNLLDGEDPSPEMLAILKRKYPNFDPENYAVDIQRQLAIADLNDTAERLGAAQGDPWIADAGMSLKQQADAIIQKPDPFVDPAQFSDAQKSDLRPDTDSMKTNVNKNIAESIAMDKRGLNASSPTPIFKSTVIKGLALGDQNLYQIIKEVADELSESIFKGQVSLGNKDFPIKYTQKEIRNLVLKQTSELHATLAEGGDDIVRTMNDYLNGKKGDYNIYAIDGEEVITISPITRAATQLLVSTLAQQIKAIATSAIDLPKGMNKFRQADQIYDMMKVLMLEQKKAGYFAGNTLGAMNQGRTGLKEIVQKRLKAGYDDIVEENENYFAYLKKIRKSKGEEVADQLHELHMLSDGVVSRLEHVHKWLQARTTLNPLRIVTGTMVDGTRVKPRLSAELSSVYYNSLLSNLRTPSKAVFSTNLVALMRPFQAYLGAVVRGNQKEAFVAASMINSLGSAYAEGLRAWRHNWDLGINRKAQSYAGKFRLEKDIENFKLLESHMMREGTKNEQRAYGILSNIVNFNTSPLARYSVNIMGAGDALARTVIGRMEMRHRAARSVIDSSTKPLTQADINKMATKIDETFRDEIFTKDRYNQYVVTDNAAALAGDEAALTTALPQELQILEQMSALPLGQFFFPFVRTGYNALRLTYAHTGLERFTRKYHDIMEVSKTRPKVLEKYGIRPQDVDQARALMSGRMAAGNTIAGLTTIMAMTGFITGDLPYDNETRQLWKQAGIQPNSFTIPGSNVYVSYRTLEPWNTIIGFFANLGSNMGALDQDFMDEAFQKGTFMIGSILVDKSMLAGVDDLVKLFSASQMSGVRAEKVLGGLFRRSMPYSGLLAGLGDAMQANEVEANNFLEEVVRRDILFKKALHPTYDILNKDRSGKPFVSSPTNPLLRMINLVSPVAIVFADKDPVKEALLRINYNLPSEITSYKGVPLTSKERSMIQKFMSQDVQFRRNLERIVSNPSWIKAVEAFEAGGNLRREGGDVRATLFYHQIRQEFQRARNRAFNLIQSEMPDLYTRVQNRIRQEQAVKSGIYNYKDLQKHGI